MIIFVMLDVPEELFMWGHEATHGTIGSADCFPTLIHLLR